MKLRAFALKAPVFNRGFQDECSLDIAKNTVCVLSHRSIRQDRYPEYCSVSEAQSGQSEHSLRPSRQIITIGRKFPMSLGTILLIILILMLIGAIPSWPHSR
ncbi:MAG: DUF3309 family protein, partial [Azonexus sp.]|nr:DUF3309 family protein [Azonexus sp.]